MLAFIGVLLRVIVGFLFACLAAGAVQVLFALSPAELIEAPAKYWSLTGMLLLGTATITALFAAPFAAISALFSEWQGLRAFSYHALVGIAIAVAGQVMLFSGQTINEPSIVNSYAVAAYLTTGLVAGRFAYRPQSDLRSADGQSTKSATV